MQEYAKKVDAAVFPRTQGGALQHIVAAKAVTFFEAMQPEFKEYARKIVSNAAALALSLKENGLKLVSGGTDNHLMLVDLTNTGLSGKEVENMLDEAGITVNKNMIPGDTRKPSEASGIRIGTAAVTSRGMGDMEMAEIGSLIADVIYHRKNTEDVRNRVYQMTVDLPLRSDD